MRAEEVHGLMEAYSKVYDSVTGEHLIEESYIDETWGTDPKKYKPSEQDKAVSRFASSIPKALGFGSKPDRKGQVYAGPGAGWVNKPAAKPAATPAAKPAATPAARPAATATPKPAATPAAKPAATSAAKPAAPAAPAAKPMSAMDQWAKANPKLAQAQKIRQQGGSRAEVNKALYNKGTAAAEKTPTVVKAGVDIFDLVKGHLLDEGYAESEDAAMVIMVNMSEEWKESILESYGVQLDELSDRTVGSAVNARIAATGAAIDRENKNRTPQNVRDSVRAADKESSIKRAAARRRKRMQANEDYVDEGRRTSLSALSGESQKRKEDEERGRPESEDEKHKRLRLGRYSPSQYKYEKDEKGNWKNMGRKDGEED
jgi:hypothetical protein